MKIPIPEKESKHLIAKTILTASYMLVLITIIIAIVFADGLIIVSIYTEGWLELIMMIAASPFIYKFLK